MKILVMNCSDSKLWYNKKVSSRYLVQAISVNGDYITKEGQVKKDDAVIIEN